MNSRSRHALVAIVLALATALVACAQPAPTSAPQPEPTKAIASTTQPPTAVPPTATPAAPEPGGNLRVAVKQDAKILNPYLGFSETETFVIGLIYDTLLYYDPEEDLQPGLADEWAFGDDGMSISFKLNPEATFHDGTPVTAQDVVFSAELVKASFPQIGRSVANVTEVEAIGEHEVKFSLRQPWPDAPRYIGGTVSIVPKAVWEKIAEPADYPNLEAPIGSGPFMLKEHAPGQRVVLQSTGKHHRSHPLIDTVTLQVVADETVAVLSLKKGDLDALSWDVSPVVAIDVRDNPTNYPDVNLATAPGTSTKTLLFNLRKAPYDDVKFRQAVAKAVDSQAIIDKALLGLAERLRPGYVASHAPWCNTDIPLLACDAETAKAELEAAGYKDVNGDGFCDLPDGSPFTLNIIVTAGQPGTDVGDVLVASLAKAGIKAAAEPLAPDAFLQKMRVADFDAALSGPSLSSQPGMMFFYFHSSRGLMNEGRVAGFNYGGYNSAEYDALAEASSTEVEWAKRRGIFLQMQELLAQDMPQVPLYTAQVLNLYRDDQLTGWVSKPAVGVLNGDTFEQLHTK